MKKILLAVLLTLSAVCFGGIFGRGTESVEYKYALTNENAKNWEKTINDIIPKECYIEDWYGNENPVMYLRKEGIMKEKDYNFLSTLTNKEEFEITKEEYDDFIDLVDKYVKKMPRTFKIRKENLKNPGGLARKMLIEGSVAKFDSPSKHIKEIADPKDWEVISTVAKLKNPTDKDAKKLRKALNHILSLDGLFNEKTWYTKEVSTRMKKLADLNNGLVGKRERNNINAKALYLAYPDYLSPIDKWGK